MIAATGIVGLCLLVVGERHREQGFQVQGASAALAVLSALAVMTLVLPNYLVATPGPTVSRSQLLFVGVITLGTGRTTVLQGMVHLTIFAAYLFLAIVP